MKKYDVIIIGGSYSGLAAGLALGRARRSVLIIDNGQPCNRQTPYSHNFLTQDGKSPKEIAVISREQVKAYETVHFFGGIAEEVVKVSDGFIIHMAAGESFHSKKIILAGGIQDIFPDIEGLSECWGITVLHCPYCHGYEVKDKKTGVLANGENAFEFTALISNWTKDLMLYTNGKSQLKSEQRDSLERKAILISEKKILKIDHESGKIKKLILEDNSEMPLEALYVKNSFRQASSLHEELGCRLTEEGHLSTDSFQRTSVSGVYACGDNSNLIRTLANAIASGTTAGMMVNKEIVLEEF